MTRVPVHRETLDILTLPSATGFATVEVRRITMAPGVHPGAHWHNGPVFGVIERGSAILKVQGAPETVLRPGDTFHEPADETIERFDATAEGVTFLAWFPTAAGAEPTLTMGAYGG